MTMDILRKKLVEFSGLQRLVLMLTLIGLLVASLSYLVSAPRRSLFWPLFFFLPLLWILWLTSVFVSPIIKGNTGRLILLWALIDLAILLTFNSFGQATPTFHRTQGADLAAALTYAPVIVPTALLVSFLPDVVTHSLHRVLDSLSANSGDGETVSLWISLSSIAAFQSWLVASIVQRWRMRRGKIEAH
jgi:hypothetical protein